MLETIVLEESLHTLMIGVSVQDTVTEIYAVPEYELGLKFCLNYLEKKGWCTAQRVARVNAEGTAWEEYIEGKRYIVFSFWDEYHSTEIN